MGESRLQEAFDLLRNCWGQTRNVELRRTLLLAIGMLRQDKAIDFLISLVAQGKDIDAKDAIAALAIYREDRELWQRVNRASEQRANQLGL
ncbi:hypothetical protein H6G96_35840 [Nostoc sp. FACHB-892]|nr:hypothetical protein [Nostoc sp. FACHB-892]MBD2731521.1 hypothetical protein [Nostoc sp. FACHB-892]